MKRLLRRPALEMPRLGLPAFRLRILVRSVFLLLALATGEHGRVEFLFQGFVGLGQDQPAAGAAQGFVGGGGDHVSVGQRVGVQPRRDQAGHVGHVDKQVGTHLVGNLAKARKVEEFGVSREAGNDHLWLMLNGQTFYFVVVDQPGGGVDAVLHGVVQLAGEADAGAVGQVPAVGQAHAQHGVTGIEQRQVHGRIRLAAGVRLHVGIIGAEQLFGAVDGQLLDFIHMFAAAVIALARIAFGVLVGQAAALGLHHTLAGVVLGGNQLDVIFLALIFGIHGR